MGLRLLHCHDYSVSFSKTFLGWISDWISDFGLTARIYVSSFGCCRGLPLWLLLGAWIFLNGSVSIRGNFGLFGLVGSASIWGQPVLVFGGFVVAMAGGGEDGGCRE